MDPAGKRPTRPTCIILAGPNGSGKTSLQDQLMLPGMFVNVDAVARNLDPADPESASIAAGRVVVARLDELISHRHAFVYETTLSSNHSVRVIRKARSAGYEVALVYVTLREADLNVERVAERVARGGHNIPEDVIRRRWHTSLKRLAEVVPLVDGASIYDNSQPNDPRLLVEIVAGRIRCNNLDKAQKLDCLIAEAVGEGLGLSLAQIFMKAKPDPN